jgi:hypothetical protein
MFRIVREPPPSKPRTSRTKVVRERRFSLRSLTTENAGPQGPKPTRVLNEPNVLADFQNA